MAGYFFLLVVLVVAAFDFWIIWKKGKQASVSAWIIRYSKSYPIFPLLLGIVVGHLTWSMSDFDWMQEEELTKRCQEHLAKQ